MKNPSIKLSSLGYIGIASLALIYTRYFSRTLRYRPDLQLYDLLLKIYIYVALPAICFSAAAFIAVVLYTLAPGTIPKVHRRFLLGIVLAILLIYAALVLLMADSILFTSTVVAYPIAFAVPGVLFALGVHKK